MAKTAEKEAQEQVLTENTVSIIQAELDDPAFETSDVIKRELILTTVEDQNILPKKINWDLKLQVAERMEKLKRKTQRAIVELLREKIANNADDDSDSEVTPQ